MLVQWSLGLPKGGQVAFAAPGFANWPRCSGPEGCGGGGAVLSAEEAFAQ